MTPHPDSWKPWQWAFLFFVAISLGWSLARRFMHFGWSRWEWLELIPNFIGLACGIMMMIHLVRWQNYSEGKNVCRKCGYDLTASPVQCPECGTAVKPGRKT